MAEITKEEHARIMREAEKIEFDQRLKKMKLESAPPPKAWQELKAKLKRKAM